MPTPHAPVESTTLARKCARGRPTPGIPRGLRPPGCDALDHVCVSTFGLGIDEDNRFPSSSAPTRFAPKRSPGRFQVRPIADSTPAADGPPRAPKSTPVDVRLPDDFGVSVSVERDAIPRELRWMRFLDDSAF